ncbi:MAG TPA: 5'-3' exonuclease H3TH domain-containing protein [Patescibacteria group bacterium]
MTKLILIDGNAILHRAYHALPPLTSKDGVQINAVYGFISMLLGIVTTLKPTHIAVCFDTPKPTFRHAQYIGYQAHRPRLESDLSSQFEIIYKVLDAMDIPIYKQEGYEADDVLGTIAKQTEKVDEVVIVTGDRDILQLVDGRVKVYMPVRGLSEGKVYGENDVVERLGVKPNQIVDYKALVGDSSDNYPGVPGVGPKTAISLIEKYQTLEKIYENLALISPKVSKKLAEGIESAGMSKKLATIVCDVPVTFHLEKAQKWDIDNKKTLNLFEKFGFKTLTQRVIKVGKKVDEEKQMSLV